MTFGEIIKGIVGVVLIVAFLMVLVANCVQNMDEYDEKNKKEE